MPSCLKECNPQKYIFCLYFLHLELLLILSLLLFFSLRSTDGALTSDHRQVVVAMSSSSRAVIKIYYQLLSTQFRIDATRVRAEITLEEREITNSMLALNAKSNRPLLTFISL